MKKITSFLSLMLMLLVCNLAKAEVWVVDEEADPLITDASQLSSPYSDADEGTGDAHGLQVLIDGEASTFWHSDWHGATTGTHYIQVNNLVDLPEMWGFSVTRRNVTNDHPTKWVVYGVPADKPDATMAECTLIDTVATPFGSNTETVGTKALPSNGFTSFRFYVIDCAPTYRTYFHSSEFQILPCKPISDLEAAKNDLTAVYVEYSTHYNDFDSQIGTEPGQYSQEAVDAFKAALDLASELIDGDQAETATLEQIQASVTAIPAAYQAVLDSKVPMPTLADGYYFVHSALDYMITGEETEDPDTGEMIPGESRRNIKGWFDNNGKLSWANLNDTTKNATFLWHMTYNPATKHYAMVNKAYDRYIGPRVADNQAIQMNGVADSTSEIDFLPYGSDERGNIVAIYHPVQTGDHIYFHAGNHNSGTENANNNQSGDVLGWAPDAGASHWYLEAVSEAEAQQLIAAYAPIKDRALMLAEVDSMLSHGKEALTIAIDESTNIHADQPLVSDGSQFFSPFAIVDGTNGLDEAPASVEDTYPLLLDDNLATFVHTDWQGGNLPPGTHYIIAHVENGLTGGLAVKVGRRSSGANDHPTKFTVYGAKEGNCDYAAYVDSTCQWVELGNLNTPYGNNTETVTSNAIEFTDTYNYFKFVCTETAPIANNRGYFHMSEFQLYPAEIVENPTSQFVALGAIAQNLQTVIAACPDSITAEYYEQLKAAYTPFWAAYVNPAALRNALKAANTLIANAEIGTDPGYYTATPSDAAIATAEAYDKAGVYTQENSDAQVEAVNAAAERIAAAAIQPAAGKWYQIKFDSQANYEAHKWATGNINDATWGDLYDRIAVPANIHTEGEGDDAVSTMEVPENIYVGQAVRFMAESDIDEEQTAFRFVALGDTTFVLQHRSGLYLGTDNNLGLAPAIFDVKAVGLGKNIIRMRRADGTDVKDGANNPVSYLHAQRAGHLLVHWGATDVASNSALFIHEIADVTGEANQPAMAVNPNGMRFVCYPLAITPSEGKLYELQGRKQTESTQTLCFNEVASTTAGRAALLVMGTPADQADEDQNTENISLTASLDNIALVADSLNGCHGTFGYKQMADDGAQAVVVGRENFATYWGYTIATVKSVAFDENGTVILDANGDGNDARDVVAYTAWVELNEVPDVTGDFALEITIAGDVTAIETVQANLQKAGKIYTLDGRLMGEGNLQTIQQMGRGIYILNGMKVAVK